MTSLYCRFCAETKSSEEVINLSISNPLLNEVQEKLNIIKIDFVNFSNKILPVTICNLCYSKLSLSYDFFLKVRRSQDILMEIFKNELKLEYYGYSDHFADNNSVKLEEELPECGDTNKLQVSIQSSLWSSYEWVCGCCNLRFHSLTDIREHCKVNHLICCSWQCMDCLERIDEYDDFIKHIKTHRSELIGYCEVCNLKLGDDHSHKDIKRYCKFCGETFKSSDELLYHMKHYQKANDLQWKQDHTSMIEHTTESWSSYPWACKYCDMIMASLEVLRDHSKQVHGKCNGFKCADCDKNLNNFEEYIGHVRSHRKDLRYHCQYCDIVLTNTTHTDQHTTNYNQCDSCGELFQYKRDLQAHISSYTNKIKRTRLSKAKEITEEDLTCVSCGKFTKSLKSLRSHMKVHTERNRDYTCDRCGKAFFTKATLLAHNIIHQNSDPEVCKICKKTFLTLTRLKKHIKTHYNERPFRCEVCHKCFGRKEHLKSHAVTHTDDMPYHCQYCEKSFKHSNGLKIHQYQHSGARPYSCELCNMYFANWSNCNKHLKRKHGTTLAKSVMTPQGKMPINPKTGKPKKLKDLETVKDWTESIMAGVKGWKVKKEYLT